MILSLFLPGKFFDERFGDEGNSFSILLSSGKTQDRASSTLKIVEYSKSPYPECLACLSHSNIHYPVNCFLLSRLASICGKKMLYEGPRSESDRETVLLMPR